jgi:MBG domain/Divergent InlB B-repeat domain
MNTTLRRLLFHTAPLLTCLAGMVRAEIEISGTTNVTQNFDGLPAGAHHTQFAWQDDVTVPGFFLHRSSSFGGGANLAGTLTPVLSPYCSSGADWAIAPPTYHGFLSLGLDGNSERSLGFSPTGQAGAANWAGGELSIIAICTNKGATLVSLQSLSFDIESWFGNTAPSTAETIFLRTKTGTLSNLTGELNAPVSSSVYDQTGWAEVHTAAGNLDYTSASGFAAPFTITRSGELTTPVVVPVGQSIALRWSNRNDGGPDAQVGIDNVVLNFRPEITPVTFTLSGLTHVYDGQPHGATITTNPLGAAYTVTYNGLPDVPSKRGDYSVEVAATGPHWTGTATGVLRITGQPQSITFTGPGDIGVDSGPVTLEAAATSGLHLTWTISGPGSVADGVFTPSLPGDVSITASQAGDDIYDAAPPATRSFQVLPPEGQAYLFLTVSGPGTVAVDPQGTYVSNGSTATLTATPDTGHTFMGWSGDVPESAVFNVPLRVSVTLSGLTHVRAAFGDGEVLTLTRVTNAAGNSGVVFGASSLKLADDGLTVYGKMRDLADGSWYEGRWRPGASQLDLIGADNGIDPVAASFDGSVLVGVSWQAEEGYKSHYRPGTGAWQVMESSPGVAAPMLVKGISSDGSRVAGFRYSPGPSQNLHGPPVGPYTYPTYENPSLQAAGANISGDGQVLIESLRDNATPGAVAHWRHPIGGPAVMLSNPGEFNSTPVPDKVNMDGTKFAGTISNSQSSRPKYAPYYWSQAAGFVLLPQPAGTDGGAVQDATEDFRFMFGHTADGVLRVWQPDASSQTLAEWMQAQFAFDATGWVFQPKISVSDDGKSLLAEARPSGSPESSVWYFRAKRVVPPAAPPGLIVDTTSHTQNVSPLTLTGSVSSSAAFQLSVYLNGSTDTLVPAVNATGNFNLPVILTQGANTLRVVVDNGYHAPVEITRTVVWQPSLTLRAGAITIPEAHEGSLPLTLESDGSITGLTFSVTSDPAFAGGTGFTLNPDIVFALALVQPGAQAGTFNVSLIGADPLPVGPVALGTLSFRARSPSEASTDSAVSVSITDASDIEGNDVTATSISAGGTITVQQRAFIADINNNGILDVGDAHLVQRLLVGADPPRAWDAALNDLNGNGSLDSGDLTLVLRTVVGLRPQPGGAARALRGVSNERLLLSWDQPYVAPGGTVTLHIDLEAASAALPGASWSLDYPVDALRIESAAAVKRGAIVPATSLQQINVSPDGTNYDTQNGRITIALSSSSVWTGSGAGGRLSEITFRVQPVADSRPAWPVTLTSARLSSADGYRIRALNSAAASFAGQPATYAAWHAAFLSTGPNTADNADADGDRIPNIVEYTLGTHPLTADGMPAIELFSFPGILRPGLRHRIRTSLNGAALVLEGSSDLLSWSPGAGEGFNSSDETRSDDGTTLRTFTPSASTQPRMLFFRLSAARVP